MHGHCISEGAIRAKWGGSSRARAEYDSGLY